MENKCRTCNGISVGRKKDFVTVIIKVVDYCNFECSFCRYFLDQNRSVSSLSIDTFKQVLIKACAYNISRGMKHLTIIFHGGEPLLWGLDNFKEAIRIENDFEKTHEGFSFVNDVQTNGSLIDDEWADFFKKNNFSIGISIDGPDEINFHRNSELSNDTVLNNLKLLSNYGCKHGILTVITEKHEGQADNYYDFLVENEIHSVGFCYCFDSDEQNIVSNKVLADFLTHFFDRYFWGNFKLHVREFEFVMKLCLGIRIEGCTFDFRRSCGNYFSVRPNGDICFCDSYTLEDEALGNIHECNFEDVKKNLILIKTLSNAVNYAENTCNKCDIKNICGGGCARHILPNGQHAFCDTYKVLYPYIYNILREKGVMK